MSYYFTINKGIPHGIACSFTLPDIVDAVLGQNEQIDRALEQILGERSSKPLRNFFKTLGVSTHYRDYALTSSDLSAVEAMVASNERAQNSVVPNEKLFFTQV
jgi:alcohol dehydrogenase YqhD (iron-dependent ADH family)